MRTADVLPHFHNSRSEIAERLGIKRASVYAWGEFVPPLRAAQIEALRVSETLKFNPAIYENWNRPTKKPRRRARG